MQIQHFFDKDTFTLSYVIHKQGSTKAIVIDPVWDIDTVNGLLNDRSVKEIFAYLEAKNLIPELCLETHAHADHLTGSQLLKNKYPQMKIAINRRITKVQAVFADLFNIHSEVNLDGSQFDWLLDDWKEYEVAELKFKVIPTPGHTAACSSYLVGSAVFVGDAMFMPDYGTGRCDFPQGSAAELYESIVENLYKLPDQTRVYTGHDYQPNGRPLKFESTIAEQKEKNIQLPANRSKSDFVAMREKRDATLSTPRLLLPSLQVNIRAGHLPTPENNGTSYLKTPLKTNSPVTSL